MTNWLKRAALAATLLLLGCGGIQAAISPTLLVSWRAVGTVHGEPFSATGEIACIPVEIGTELTSIGHEAFPRWTLIPLSNGRVLALDVSASCYVDSLTQEDILIRGRVFEDAPHPRWTESIASSDWVVRLDQVHQRTATRSDRDRVIQTAQVLLRGTDIFCAACDWSRTPDPFTRIVRKDLSTAALPADLFDRWGEGSAGACRRSRPIPIPGTMEEAGIEERHLATCTRLRREDPLSRDAPPNDDRCDYLDMQLSTIAPNQNASNRIWRRSEFGNPLIVDACAIVLDEALASFRTDFTSGDVRLYQSDTSTFTLYAGESAGILRLYERNPADLARAELELPP